MFDDKTTSLGTLDDCEQSWVFSFLRGSSWEELFESLDEDTKPPAWLVEWSKSWECEDVFTIDDLDPYIGEYRLITDGDSKEVWAAIHQGDDQVVFKSIPATNGEPDPDAVCSFFLQELENIGDFPFVGNFTIDSPEWLPSNRMEDFLRRRMKELGEQEMHGLTLEEWLNREYDEPLSLPSSNEPPDA
jgi:hypothetical protein